jgi:peptide-methionine (S)-S-oxide reductase
MKTLATIIVVAALAAGCGGVVRGEKTSPAETPQPAEPPAAEPNTTKATGAQPMEDTATFAAGCFWGVEEIYRQTPGVIRTAVGYTGGAKERPTYKEVCTGRTGHAEAVHIVFDPSRVTFEQLLDVFWANHNPTTLNRQGPDVGTQYRSAIFYQNEAQRAVAEASKARLAASGVWRQPIVTQIVPATTFWVAEEYHQQYLAKRGLGVCH